MLTLIILKWILINSINIFKCKMIYLHVENYICYNIHIHYRRSAKGYAFYHWMLPSFFQLSVAVLRSSLMYANLPNGSGANLRQTYIIKFVKNQKDAYYIQFTPCLFCGIVLLFFWRFLTTCLFFYKLPVFNRNFRKVLSKNR